MRELAILVLAAGTPETEAGAAAAMGPGGRTRPDRPVGPGAVDLPELAHALAARRLLCGFGEPGEVLRAMLPAPGAEIVAAAAGEAQALLAHARALDGFSGDLLVLPASRAAIAPAVLAALCELHAAEGNAATILAADRDPAAGRGVLRDELGRVTGLGDPSAAGPGEFASGETASGVTIFHWPSLLAALRERVASAPDAPWSLASAVGWVREAGRPVGSLRAPGARVPCPRCHAELGASEENGLLLVNASACLAVERPGFNSGQLACYPRRHVTCALSLGPEEWSDLATLLREGERLLRQVYAFDALNAGLSSGTGAHLSVQLIPRWIGDLNFLPLVSGFKAVPESPQAAWRRYREVMA